MNRKKCGSVPDREAQLLRGFPSGKLGVFHYAGIGDWMVFAPFLREIKRLRPRRKIYVVASRNIEWMLKGDPHIDGYSILPDCSVLQKHFRPDEKIFISTFAGFHNLTHCRLHILDLTRKILGLPFTKNEYAPSCFLRPEDESLGQTYSKAFKGRMIAVCNDTSQKEKSWDPARWGRLVEQFKEYIFVQIGDVASRHIPGAMLMAGKISFTQAMGIVKHARLFVGVDGVFNHVARTLEVPQVILWGPPHPVYFAYRRNSVNIWKGVFCGTCPHTPGGPCMSKSKYSLSPCLEAITVPDVVNAIRKQLGQLHDAAVRYYEPPPFSPARCRGCVSRRLCTIDFFAKPLSDLFLWKVANPAKR